MIAVDQDGRPALIANSLGKGKTLLCAYPLESYLATFSLRIRKRREHLPNLSGVPRWAGIKPRFRTNQPSVEAASLDAQDHGYVVVVNHSAKPQQVTVTSGLSLEVRSACDAEGGQPVSLHGSQWDLDLQPYGAASLGVEVTDARVLR